MTTIDIPLRRIIFESSRTFEEVISDLFVGIGPLHDATHVGVENTSYEAFQKRIRERLGTADLMEFMRLDLGSALRIDPNARPYRIVRIIAGNPLIMKEMVQTVPHAGSYAPVTILVYEAKAKVFLAYDLMASAIAIYNSPAATRVAEDLDEKVLSLLRRAAQRA